MKRRFKPRLRKKDRTRKKDDDNESREPNERDDRRGEVPSRDRIMRGGYDRSARREER